MDKFLEDEKSPAFSDAIDPDLLLLLKSSRNLFHSRNPAVSSPPHSHYHFNRSVYAIGCALDSQDLLVPSPSLLPPKNNLSPPPPNAHLPRNRARGRRKPRNHRSGTSRTFLPSPLFAQSPHHDLFPYNPTISPRRISAHPSHRELFPAQSQSLLKSHLTRFFVRSSDTPATKIAKLRILLALVDAGNVGTVTNEFKVRLLASARCGKG